nr:MAG TPA: hypothetical protein [Caudoviricetes sp.]
MFIIKYHFSSVYSGKHIITVKTITTNNSTISKATNHSNTSNNSS